MKPSLLVCSVVDCAFGVRSEASLSNARPQRFLPVFFLVVLGFTFRSVIWLPVSYFCFWCEVWIQLYCFCVWMSKDCLFSPLNHLCISVRSRLSLCGSVSGLCSDELIYFLVPVPAPHCPDDRSFVLHFGVRGRDSSSSAPLSQDRWGYFCISSSVGKVH